MRPPPPPPPRTKWTRRVPHPVLFGYASVLIGHGARRMPSVAAPTLATSSRRPTERGCEHAPGPALHAHQSAHLPAIGCFSALLPSPRTEEVC